MSLGHDGSSDRTCLSLPKRRSSCSGFQDEAIKHPEYCSRRVDRSHVRRYRPCTVAIGRIGQNAIDRLTQFPRFRPLRGDLETHTRPRDPSTDLGFVLGPPR